MLLFGTRRFRFGKQQSIFSALFTFWLKIFLSWKLQGVAIK